MKTLTRPGAQGEGAQAFEPVWVSSLAHLERHALACKRATLAQRMVGRYPLDPDMPQLAGTWIGDARMPVMMQALGRLTLSGGELRFVADSSCAAPPAGLAYKNLDEALRFTVALSALTHVECFEHRSTPWYPVMDWVQLAGYVPEGHLHVLLAVGGSGPGMTSTRDSTRRLQEAIARARDLAWRELRLAPSP